MIYDHILHFLTCDMIYYCPDDDISLHFVAENAGWPYTVCKVSVVQRVRQDCGNT